jgi:hypothetical protein
MKPQARKKPKGARKNLKSSPPTQRSHEEPKKNKRTTKKMSVRSVRKRKTGVVPSAVRKYISYAGVFVLIVLVAMYLRSNSNNPGEKT